MKTWNILVVEDKAETHQVISKSLRKEGFKTSVITDGAEVMAYVRMNKPDLIILAILLPSINGIDLCKNIREFSDIPIIFISKKTDDVSIVLALEVGGDDYITKPFSPAQLVARVKAHLRRHAMIHAHLKKSDILAFSGLEINISTHNVYVDGQAISLSPKEFELLVVLARNPHRIFDIEDLYKYVWSSDSLGDTRTIIVHLSNIRKKIESDRTNPKYILTVRGKGYKFNPSV